jgi:hypothetical protein
MLLELAAQYCIEKEDHDQEENTQITFHFTDHGGNVVSSESFISVVYVDAGFNHIDKKYKVPKDYPAHSKLTGEEIYDRDRVYISHYFSCSSTATGTFEGSLGLYLISHAVGLNIKAEVFFKYS